MDELKWSSVEELKVFLKPGLGEKTDPVAVLLWENDFNSKRAFKNITDEPKISSEESMGFVDYAARFPAPRPILQSQIGVGGSSVVYKANTQDTDCVVKVYKWQDDCVNEVKTLAALAAVADVPHIVAYDNLLHALLRSAAASTDSHFTSHVFLTSLVSIFEAVHAKRLCHCDVRPPNILQTGDANPLVVDFASAVDINAEVPFLSLQFASMRVLNLHKTNAKVYAHPVDDLCALVNVILFHHLRDFDRQTLRQHQRHEPFAFLDLWRFCYAEARPRLTKLRAAAEHANYDAMRAVISDFFTM